MVWDGSGGPLGGPGQVGRTLRRSSKGREATPEV